MRGNYIFLEKGYTSILGFDISISEIMGKSRILFKGDIFGIKQKNLNFWWCCYFFFHSDRMNLQVFHNVPPPLFPLVGNHSVLETLLAMSFHIDLYPAANLTFKSYRHCL